MTGIGTIYNVLDVNGNVLVPGKIYLSHEKRIRIQREKFGAGNFLDTYYRVFYLDETLEEKSLCVDVKYPNGIFNGGVYQSELTPV